MKRLLAALLLAAAFEQAAAATLLIDGFDDGDFSLSSSGLTSDTSGITSPLVDQRSASGVGPDSWTASVVGSGSTFSYSVDQVIFSTLRNRIALNYANQSSNPFSLLGSDAFSLQFSELLGEGILRVSINGAFVSSDIPLINANELIVPFTEIGNPDFGALSSVQFSFTAVTQEFSFTLDQIGAVPEPTVAGLLLASLLTVALHRRRN